MSDEIEILSPGELNERLRASGPLLLIDVRLEEDHQAESLPDSTSHCVFEVSFLDSVGRVCEDRSTPLCVYGAAGDSHESRMAAAKLRDAGFTRVSELRDGVAGWKAAGFETLKGEPVKDAQPLTDGRLEVDLAESRVEWLGRNLINKHWGTIGLESGHLEFAEGSLVGGEFVLDMTEIQCTDLAGSDLHDVLIDHLKSDDFFDVDRWPTARFDITAAAPVEGAAAGAPNIELQGKLTMKGRSRPITFLATAGLTDEGKPAAQSAVAIDRTRWNVLYGSGKFFHRLAGHLVNDMIDLQLRMITR